MSSIDIAALPDDPAALRHVIGTLLADLSAERMARQAAEAGLRAKAWETEHLRAQLAQLRRMQFGRSSERLRAQIAQLEHRPTECGQLSDKDARQTKS